jgi:UDP-N-acetylmuramate--alanine ligase
MHVNSQTVSYIDDYAHHPEELIASIQSVKKLFPLRKILVAFQPHLYSRTHDFAPGFAQALSLADSVLLLPIYPARELPIAGVTSQWLLSLISAETMSRVVEKTELVEHISSIVSNWISIGESVVVMTLGAGDIDRLVNDIKQNLNMYE